MKQIIVILFSSVLIACAASQHEQNPDTADTYSRSGDCILESSVRGYTVLDESNLIVSGSGRRNYHVVLLRRAWGLGSSWNIAFRSPTGRICAGFSEVIFREHGNRAESIRIERIIKLSEEAHEDLLIQWGKKAPEIEHGPAPKDVEGAEVEELDPTAET